MNRASPAGPRQHDTEDDEPGRGTPAQPCAPPLRTAPASWSVGRSPLLDDAAFEASRVVLGDDPAEVADNARSARCDA